MNYFSLMSSFFGEVGDVADMMSNSGLLTFTCVIKSRPIFTVPAQCQFQMFRPIN